MYYIESAHNKDFDSIMQSCWWVIVTITTVGYGDMYPQSAGGKLFGGFVLTLGIVFLALPMTIIVSKFSFVYEREKMWKELEFCFYTVLFQNIIEVYQSVTTDTYMDK